jgi:hypothetical protein
MLPLSAFVRACPAVHLGSARSCSPALIRACPTVHALVLPFVWAAPVRAHRPSFVLVPPFIWAVPVRTHRPSFVLVDTRRSFGQAPFMLTCARHCSFMLATAGWSSCSLPLVRALHSFAGPRSCLAFARAHWYSFWFCWCFVCARSAFVRTRSGLVVLV